MQHYIIMINHLAIHYCRKMNKNSFCNISSICNNLLVLFIAKHFIIHHLFSNHLPYRDTVHSRTFIVLFDFYINNQNAAEI